MKILLFLSIILAAGGALAMTSKEPVNDHFNGRIFHNIDPNVKLHGLLSSIKWRLTSKRVNWPHQVPNVYEDTPPSLVQGDKIRLSFVGHMTFLIQTQSLNILTDPVYSERCSPFSFIGPKRVSKPGIAIEKLPHIDLVLISHNHYDHMDIDTLKLLVKHSHPKIIVPIGNKSIITKNIPDADITEMDWYESFDFTKEIKIHLEPAQHWSARGLFDLNKALWGSFVIGTPKQQILFVGDTGYSQEMFENIGNKYTNIALSLIPIGAYEPRWFMQPVHMNPQEAVRAHIDLKSRKSIASHFATFQLSDEGYGQPVVDLEEAKAQLSVSNFDALKIGQFLEM